MERGSESLPCHISKDNATGVRLSKEKLACMESLGLVKDPRECVVLVEWL